MKDMIKIRTIALFPAFMTIIFFLVLMTGSAHAFGSGFRDRGGFSRGSKSVENKSLNLSPEQEAQLKGLKG